MRKKRLMELKPLKVMNRHIADAKKTEISLSPLEKQRGEPGKYRMYCRAAVEKGILKVYLFAVTDIEENINFPRYRLFISRKERRFITYDEKLKKWRKALLESILSFMPERGIKRAVIQIAKLPAMKSREESSLQMERKFPISFMICSNNGKCVGFRVEVLGIILAVTVNIKEWFIHIPCRICPGMN